MAHRTTHRRQLASAPESPCLDPAKTQLKAASSYPDPVLRSRPLFNISKHLSRLHPNHLTKTPQKPSNNNISNPPLPCKDIHLQAKSMTVSADFDASKYSRVNSKHHRPPEGKEASKEKGSKNDRSKEKGSKNDSLSHSSEVEEAKEKKKKSLVVVESQEDVLKRMSVSLGGGGGGRRRSFCGSQVELSDFLASNGAKVVSVDMPPFMQIHAVDCARKTRDSLEKFTSKTLALTLKKEFDGVYGPAWHCIVGTSFGSFVTHSVGGFLYFSLDHKLYILLFKTTVQRAD